MGGKAYMIGTYALLHRRPQDLAKAALVFNQLRDQFLGGDTTGTHQKVWAHFQMLSKEIKRAIAKLPKPEQDQIWKQVDDTLVRPLLENAHRGDGDEVWRRTEHTAAQLLKQLKLSHPLYPQ